MSSTASPRATLAVLLLSPGSPGPALDAAIAAARVGGLEVLALAPDGTPVPEGAALLPCDPLRHRGAALALAAERARGATLVLLHDDAEPAPGFLEPLLAAAGRPDVAVAGARLLEPGAAGASDGLVLTYGRPWPLSFTPQGDTSAASGRRAALPVAAVPDVAVAVDRERLARLGGFDAAFLAGGAVLDLCLRGGAAGLRAVVARASHVGHRAACDAWRGDEPLLTRRWLGRVPLHDADRLRAEPPGAAAARGPISVVVPAGSLAGLPRFVEALLGALGAGDELLIAGAAEGGVAAYAEVLARDARPTVRGVEPGQAGGTLPAASAEALAVAACAHVAVLHPSGAVPAGLLDELSRLLDARPEVGLVAFPAGAAGQAACGRRALLAAVGAADPSAFFATSATSLQAAARASGGQALVIA